MNIYDEAVANSINGQRAQEARFGLMSAAIADHNPDYYAEMRRVAKSTGVPVDTAIAMPKEMKLQARMGEIDFDSLAMTAPATAAILADVEKAKIAHDDVENMSLTERVARQFIGGAGENVGRSLHGFGELANVAQRRTLAAIRSAFLPTPRFDGTIDENASAGPLIGDSFKELGNAVMQGYRRRVMVPAKDQGFADQVVGGLGQVGSQIAMLPFDRGAGLWAQGASILSEATAKSDAPQWKKDLAVVGGSAVTGITERYAMDKLLEPLAVPIKNQIVASLARIGIGAASEGGQEFSENIGHDLLQKYLTDPTHQVDLGQAGQDGAVGATVGGIVRAVVESALHVKLRGERRAQHANGAESDAQAVQALAELAQASKLRPRDPDAYAQIIAEATDGGRIQDVFISAQTLAQSPNVQKIASVTPSVKEQYQTALETGGDIRIPVAEFAAHIAGNGYAQDIINDIKTQPDGMTRAEAQQFAQEQAQGINEGELAQETLVQHASQTHTEAVRMIEQNITDQLNSAGRFSPTVNKAYAALPTAFFDTMATRLGVSPSELWNAYGAKISAEGITGPMLSQDEKAGFVPREFTQGGQHMIGLFKHADLSSFLHETGHWFLESYSDMARVSPALQADMQIVHDWLGVKDAATWDGMTLEEKRKHHEQFARGFEAYLYEGKAPSIEMRSLFHRFSAWLANVYRSIRGLNVELSDDVRAVMDRMLATDEHIQEAQRARSFAPIFTSEAQAAEHGVNWREYQAISQASSDEAMAQLNARSQRDMAYTSRLRDETVKRLSKDAAELRKGLRKEVEAEVAAQPVYAAQRFFKHGEIIDAEGNEIKAEAGHRLSIEALREMYPATALNSVEWQKLGYGKYGMLAEKGLHPDQAAGIFEFPSGDAMVREILNAQPFRIVVEGLTEQRMLERHGDLATAEDIARAADEAIHNDVRLRFLATELSGLQKAVGGAQALAKMAKDYAAGLINKSRVGQLRPTQYAAADARAGKAAENALRKGNTAEAIKQKRFQIINHTATRAAYEAQTEIEKTLTFFRGIVGAKPDQLKTRNVDLVNAARAILAEYGVGDRAKRARDYMEAVKSYDPELFAVLEPMLQDAEETAKPIEHLTVSELRALRDNVESLWYLARRSKQVEIDGRMIDREKIAATLNARLEALGVPDTAPGEGRAVTESDKTVRYLMGLRAALRRVESWVDRMDGGKITGAFRSFIFTPISEAADRYRTDAGKYLRQYRDLLKAIEPTLTAGRIAAPEIKYTFGYSKGDAGKAELLHAILHTGNDSNKRKLLLGRGWASEQADGSLDTRRWDAFIQRMINEGKLSKADFDFAQGVWDLLESTKPLAQKTHRDVFGRYFDEVTANEFTVKFDENTTATYRGGYVPAITDTFEVQDAAINSELDAINQGNSFMFPATARGFTKGRVEYNRPLALDLRILPQHIDKVLLFAHLEPRVRDVMRTLRAKGFAGTLNRYDPTAYTDLLLPWLNRAAKQTVETPATGWAGKLADRFFRTARTRSGMAAMFANVTNAMQQITGLSISALQVKPSHLSAATWRYVRSPAEMSEQIAQLSPFMASRQNNEVMAMRNEIEDLLVNPGAYDQVKGWTQKHAYFLQSAFQNTVDTITWAAAYDQAVTEGVSNIDAVRSANAAVRATQGSLSPEDISRYESGTAFARMFTQFQGYFNMQANLLGTEFAKVAQDMGLKDGAGRLFYIFALGFLVPAWFSEAIVQAMRGGLADDDKDGYLDDFLASFFGAPLRNLAAMVPVVGQAGVLIANSFNRKPYDDRMSTAPAVSMIESAASAPHSIYKAMAEDGKASRAIRDTLTLISIVTGIPVAALGKPLGYAADVAQGRIEPTGPLDAARGVISGAASQDSKR